MLQLLLSLLLHKQLRLRQLHLKGGNSQNSQSSKSSGYS